MLLPFLISLTLLSNDYSEKAHSTLLNEDTTNNDFNDIVLYQFEQYANDFENFKSDKTTWLLIQTFDSFPHTIEFFIDFINNNKKIYSEYYEIIKCAIRSNNSLDFLGNFVLCHNSPTITLSFLYDNFNSFNFDAYDNLINKEILSEKELVHYNYIFHDSTITEYNINENDINILDFYYYDNLYDSDSYNNHIDDVTSWINMFSDINNLKNSICVANLFITTNALYKMNNEYLVYELSKIINSHKELPLSNNSVRLLEYISYSSFINGFYKYDINLYRNILLPKIQFFSKEKQLILKIDYGVTLFRIGSTTESLEIFEYVYDYIEHIADFRYQSALLNNLGISYLNVGYFEKYIQLQLEALEFAENNNDIEFQINFLNNLYIYHRRIQNWSTAINYLNKVKEIANKSNNTGRIAHVEMAMGTYHRDHTNHIDSSLIYLYNAHNLINSHNNFKLQNTIINEIGNTYKKINEYDKSLKYYNKSSNLARSKNDSLLLAYSYTRIADVHIRKNDYETADIYIDSLINTDRSMMRFRNQVDRETIISKSYIYNNKTDKALSILRDYAEETLSRLIHSSDLQSGHILLDSEYISLFNILLNTLISNSKYNEAIYWMDEIKNLSSASFYNNPALKSSILDEDELVLDFALRNRIDRLRSEIHSADDSQKIQLSNNLLEAISHQNSLRRKVLQNIELESVDLGDLQSQLGRSDIILYFSKFENNLFTSTITSGSFDINRIEFSSSELSRIDTLVDNLSSDQVHLTELQWIKERIIDKLNISDRYTNYFVIPDGFLYHIPIEILPVNEVSNDFSYGEAEYLIENVAISYANSLRDLKSSFSHKPSRDHELDYLGIGISRFENSKSRLVPGRVLPPLPLAEKEVTDISDKLERLSNKSYYLSQDGTVDNFRNNAGNSRILHLASHSEVYENDPLYSLIHLNPANNPNMLSGNPGNQDNGLIYAYELFDMNLSNEMIMLNSCESGSGSYIQGSGIVGFSRAFNYAGVQSLVMNLWSIRDRSAYELSVSFYSYLNDGLNKNEAMRRAKIDYINNVNSNPSYWGSFVVYGNIDPVIPSRTPWIITFTLIVLASFSLLIAWLRYPNKIRIR